MRAIGSILLWSIIAAAFIGPGTITTAASAGAEYGFALLWALLFSTVACLVLQEASARLKVVSGKSLGAALRLQYPAGVRGTAVLVLVLGAIVVGCAAYEAGNILGGVAGMVLVIDLPANLLALISGLLAALLLWFSTTHRVARLLSALVAVMGIAFIWTAFRLAPSILDLLQGALVPTLPQGSGVLALGLVGTTVVPYNIFLGSGIAGGQSLREIRFGLTIAILLGGLISMAVVIVGAASGLPFGFDSLSAVLATRLGPWGSVLFAFGLFAAGLSSAITAPLAAAVTARSLFSEGGSGEWGDRDWRFRLVWIGVLGVGIAFGVSGVRPVPAIILAQAMNGIVLPVAAVFLLLAVNDRSLMGKTGLNGPLSNLLTAAVTAVAILLGTGGVWRAAASGLGSPRPSPEILLKVSALLVLLVALPVGLAARSRRRRSSSE